MIASTNTRTTFFFTPYYVTPLENYRRFRIINFFFLPLHLHLYLYLPSFLPSFLPFSLSEAWICPASGGYYGITFTGWWLLKLRFGLDSPESCVMLCISYKDRSWKLPKLWKRSGSGGRVASSFSGEIWGINNQTGWALNEAWHLLDTGFPHESTKTTHKNICQALLRVLPCWALILLLNSDYRNLHFVWCGGVHGW